MRRTKTKGINFRSFVAALRRLRGDAAVERTLERLPDEIAQGLRIGAITTGGWYPCDWYSKLHAAAQAACGEGPELARAVSREGIQEDFRSGVYRLITLSAAPEAIFKWAPRVVGLYWDGGRLVVENADAGRAMGRFEGFHGFDRNLWEDMIGGSVGVMELAGAKNVTVRVLSGGGDGEDHMVYVVRWTT
jgi:hypothetical protein